MKLFNRNPNKLKVRKHRKSGMYLLVWGKGALFSGDDAIAYHRKYDAKRAAKELELERSKYL